ncbi:MAG: hypothetical protein GY906_08270 [bacterium]|nr:hypothetical protein [bacterium]
MPGDLPSGSDRKTARVLAQGIVRAQTNVFIKELLRKNGIKIGATKAQFEANMLDAIDAGVLRLEHFGEWLNEVEGWGNQHIYLYNVPTGIARSFASSRSARRRVEEAGLEQMWDAPNTLVFPETVELTGISYDESLLMEWHKGTQYWIRAEKLDKDNETIDGDEYQFRAYRGRSVREVMRFELRPRLKLAGLFVPKAANSKEHKEAVTQAKQEISSILDFEAMERRPVRLNNVIKKLDQAIAFPSGSNVPAVSPQSTRLKSGDAYVEFASVSDDSTYLDSGDVREVRMAIRESQLGNFDGSSGSFKFATAHQARVQLFAAERRIRVWTSLTASDVWAILETLARHQ